MTGNQAMWTGFGKSVNTYFVQLEQKVGADLAVRMAERLGLRWRTDIDKLQASPAKAKGWGSFTLGRGRHDAAGDGQRLRDGRRRQASTARRCRSSKSQTDGSPATLPRAGPIAEPRCTQAVSPQAARAAADAARCVTGYGAAASGCGGWSTAPGVYGMVKRPVAGKTGTTDDNRAAWFVGFTPDLAVASFMADPDNPFHAGGRRQRMQADRGGGAHAAGRAEGQAGRQLHAADRRHPRQGAELPVTKLRQPQTRLA